MAHSTRKLGVAFTWLGWIIGVVVLTLMFNKLIDDRYNPNQVVNSLTTDTYQEIYLQRNRLGHYLFDGHINDQRVTFLVDTGATTTSIPAHMQQKLGLKKGFSFAVQTANGSATAYATRINNLQLGTMQFHNVQASLNPGMNGDEVLLGMNILKQLELVQRGDTLIMRRPGQ